MTMILPLVSWISHKGRSSCCKTHISWRYPLIELSSLLLSIGVFYLYSHYIDLVTPWYQSIEFWALLTFGYFTLTISITDLEHYLIPDRLSLPLLWLGLIAASLKLPHWHVTLDQSLNGAIFGYVTLWLVFQLHRVFTGREGMGYGDFKLLSALGAWVGLQQVSLIFGISGLLFIMVAIAQQKLKPDHVMPFGPFLVAATWMLMVATILGHRFF
jgi:leader peptidase (prepilin peptidase)/N-methyltransferase